MKKTLLLSVILLAFCVVMADAQPKKIALIGRISWCPESDGAASGGNLDFDVMPHFSMDDELTRHMLDGMGYLPILMPDYVVQYMLMEGDEEGRGYDVYINPGVYMWQPNFFQDNEYDLIYNTGTCWSSIAPPVKDYGIPVVQGEHSCFGTRAKLGSCGFFIGEESGDISGIDTLVLTEAGKTHELTAGFPDEIVVFGDGPEGPPENPGDAWTGIYDSVDLAAEGTVVLATWKDNPTKAAIAVVEAGGALADGVATARMSTIFWTGQVRPMNGAELPPDWLNVIEHLTADGEELTARIIRWTMGETPVGMWQSH